MAQHLYMHGVEEIRHALAVSLTEGDFVIDKTGVKTIEIIGASFIADEETIFGKVNEDYVQREIEWYRSQSLNVNDIPGGPPTIWRQVADKNGFINSNYGWVIFSEENGNQYDNVLNELRRNPNSRRATMIYNRPSMWLDYNRDGRSDFMCCQNVRYFIRDSKLISVVDWRSQDVTYGYKNDRAWMLHVAASLANELDVSVGEMIWQVGSLHLYSRDFHMLDHFSKTGEITISKKEYSRLYPESPYADRTDT